MNDRYRRVIRNNKSDLIEFTSLTPQLLAKCTEKNILTHYDAEVCSNKNLTSGEKKTNFYDALLTKDAERYAVFVDIMEEECQSQDVIKILKESLENRPSEPESIPDVPQTDACSASGNPANSDSLIASQRFTNRLTNFLLGFPPQCIFVLFIIFSVLLIIISILFGICFYFHVVHYSKNLEQNELNANQVALPAMAFLTLENYTSYLCRSLGLSVTFTFKNVSHIILPEWLETCNGSVPHHLIIKGIPSHSQILDILSSEFKSSLKMLTLLGDSTCQEFNPEKSYCKDTTTELLVMTDLHFLNIRKECSGLYKFLDECVTFRMRYNVALGHTRVFPYDVNYLVSLQVKSGNPLNLGATVELCEGCKDLFVFRRNIGNMHS